MDEELLARAKTTASDQRQSDLNGYAAHARDHLLARRRKIQAAKTAPSLQTRRRSVLHLRPLIQRRSGGRSF
jgi:hypothetical protein